MTATELLTGDKGPLSGHEFNYWQAYFSQKAALEEKAQKDALKKKSGGQGQASQEFKKTMGTQN